MAVRPLPPDARRELQPIISAKGSETSAFVAKPRPLVKNYALDDLVPVIEKGFTKQDFERGRRLFGQASCFGCHRFDNEGGAQGPDLTIISGRFSARDLLEKIVNPNKAISDQYAAVDMKRRMASDSRPSRQPQRRHDHDQSTCSTLADDRHRSKTHESMVQSKPMMPTAS